MNDFMNGLSYEDPMDEIYAIRRKISAECGYDVNQLIARAKARMAEDIALGRRRYVRLPIARRERNMV